MGKLLDILNQVGKVSSAGIGFLGQRAQTRAKPAMIIVALASADTALTEGAVKGGAEAVLLPAPEGRRSLTEQIKAQGAMLEALRGSSAIVGLALEGVQSALEDSDLAGAAQAGIDFVTLSMMAPARLLDHEDEKLDKVVTLSLPHDDLFMLFLRGVNLLPVSAIQFEPAFSADGLRVLTLAEHVRYRLMRESLRFPVLGTVEGALDTVETRVLVEMGLQGVVLRVGAGETPDALRERVVKLRRLLEEAPKPEGSGAGVPSVGTLAGSPGVPQPQEPHTEP